MIVLLMGVSGAGKTAVGSALAAALGCRFAEGDRYHPSANVAKMAAGTPLDDVDRWPWLQAIAADIDAWVAAGESAVVACSALKRAYRALLVGRWPGVRLVYLRGAQDVIAARLAARRDHFMPPGLLDSQFAALEEPGPEEGALVVEVSDAVPAIVERIRAALAAPAQPQ